VKQVPNSFHRGLSGQGQQCRGRTPI